MNARNFLIQSFIQSLARLALIGVAMSLSACVIQAPAQPNDPAFAPVLGPGSVPPQPVAGSLYRQDYSLSLFDDRKAHRVGDIITIVLNERTSSTKSSKVEISKESDTQFAEDPTGTAGTLLGTQPSWKNLSALTDIQHDRDFTGEGDADQSNSLTGNITVTVADVLPNGNLVVRGEKWMTLNRGDEYIRISGIIRPEDVTPDNTIASQKLANARIAYSGTGEVADSGAMGWASRFFNHPLWPF